MTCLLTSKEPMVLESAPFRAYIAPATFYPLRPLRTALTSAHPTRLTGLLRCADRPVRRNRAGHRGPESAPRDSADSGAATLAPLHASRISPAAAPGRRRGLRLQCV